jgi:hypothetical protein
MGESQPGLQFPVIVLDSPPDLGEPNQGSHAPAYVH